MSIINTARKQTAVWWSREGTATNTYGVPKVCVPKEVRVRWDDVVEQFIDKTGSPQMSKAKVMVDFLLDFAIGDYLFLGTLDKVLDKDDASTNDSAWEIKALQKIPNLKNTETLVIAIL